MSAGSGRDGGWGERMCACETKRGAEREGGGLCVCVSFSVVIILIT